MNAPRGLVGAILVLWGASNGFTALGVIMGVVVEAMRFMRAGPAMARPRNLMLAVRASVLLVAAGLIVAVAAGRFPDALYAWLRWLPVMLLPLPLAASLAGGRIPDSVFYEAMRAQRTAPGPSRGVDVMFGFAAATLVAAGTGSRIEAWFYPAVIAIAAWALIARMPGTRRSAGIVLIVAASALGYGVHRGLYSLQSQLEDLDPSIVLNAFQSNPDPFRERTRIGDMGKVKLNDRIVMRVVPEGPRPEAILLRESAFDRYHGGEWQASKRAFQPVPHEGDRWILRAGAAPAALSVRRTLPSEGLLALPEGARVLALHADAVEALPTGAVRARGAPRFVTMRVAYDEQDPGQALAGDTFVPEELAPLLDHVIEAASLRRSTAIETVDAVRRFFAENFAYSLFLATASGAPSRTLSDFLLRDRKGHCEYFATSTALLLRRLGVPAQYTVGYSAQEFSSLENAFVVRSRHAHAWTRALVDGRWITVDTTPSRWAQDEEEAARGFFGPLTDRVSWAIDRLVQWWVGSTVADLAWGLGAIVVIALAPFAFMFVRRAWRRRAGPAERVTAHRAARAWQGVEAAMARRGHVRARGETVLAWARRLQGEAGVELVELARAYYRARFDPSAKESDIEEFERRVRPLSRATSRAPSGPDSRWRA